MKLFLQVYFITTSLTTFPSFILTILAITKGRRPVFRDILSMNDAQQAYTHFHKVYTDLYNSCFPLKEIKSGYKTKKPWLSEGMKKQIKIKNRLYRRYKKTHNPEHEVLYKRFKNKLNGNLITRWPSILKLFIVYFSKGDVSEI